MLYSLLTIGDRGKGGPMLSKPGKVVVMQIHIASRLFRTYVPLANRCVGIDVYRP